MGVIPVGTLLKTEFSAIIPDPRAPDVNKMGVSKDRGSHTPHIKRGSRNLKTGNSLLYGFSLLFEKCISP